MKIKGKDIVSLGIPPGPAVGLALVAANKIQGKNKKTILKKLEDVRSYPHNFLTDKTFGAFAQELITPAKIKHEVELREQALPYTTFGADGIEHGAKEQMRTAMRLPVAVGGALMPDAHHGYGLPIGGVLATDNAVIPYAVGVDIGCRMCMSIFDAPPNFLNPDIERYKGLLMENTNFGKAVFSRPRDHEILHDPLFKEVPIVKKFRDRAYKQIGTSGGGNHFVEFGIVEIFDGANEWGIKPNKYLAVLSHSGSRGLGAAIAQHYSKVARTKCPLPKIAQHLAWLDISSEEGQEYWLAMTLAGNYASACHHQIHDRMAKSLETKPIATIENHHNFAWKERLSDGREAIVHRKGATPAGKGVLGIIPGSMTAPGFIVRGKGNTESLHSASHGAGRKMSRSKAKQMLDRRTVDRHLKKVGVHVIGSGLDEAPMAYKDIHHVMGQQADLVEIVGKFLPKVVRMCGEKGYFEQD